MTDYIGSVTVHRTRFVELGYANTGRGLWRIVALDGAGADGWHGGTLNCVGPHYRTKAELLADLTRYAAEYGCADAAAPEPVTINRDVMTGYQAIVTRYIGPSNTRGSRVRATAQADSITVAYDQRLGTDANHLAAARKLADKYGWRGTLIGGGMPGGNGDCFVMVDEFAARR